MGGGGVAWRGKNAFVPSFEFGRSLASVFLLPRGRLFVWLVCRLVEQWFFQKAGG